MTDPRDSPVVMICGPTASGKSALARYLAEHIPSAIINADSMQVYRDLEILTARPSAGDMEQARHNLFGFLDGSMRSSVAAWKQDAFDATESAWKDGLLPLLVGGSGLYFEVFSKGLSPIPDVSPAIRERLHRKMTACGPEQLHIELQKVDPELAAALPPNDRQRIQRGLEIFEETGTCLSTWQATQRQGGWNGPCLPVLLTPERAELYDLCDRRFDAMIADGAIEEVRTLSERRLDPTLPIMRALGVRPILAYLEGRIDLQEAVSRSCAATRQYAKRQDTWFRHRMDDAVVVSTFGFACDGRAVVSGVREFLRAQSGTN